MREIKDMISGQTPHGHRLEGNTVKMLTVYKVTHRFGAIPIRIPMVLCQKGKIPTKIYMDSQGTPKRQKQSLKRTSLQDSHFISKLTAKLLTALY